MMLELTWQNLHSSVHQVTLPVTAVAFGGVGRLRSDRVQLADERSQKGYKYIRTNQQYNGRTYSIILLTSTGWRMVEIIHEAPVEEITVEEITS